MTLFSVGFRTLFYKESLRFWKVATQTIAAPVVTAMLYLLIFGHVLDGRVEMLDGGSRMNTRLPVILDWISEDDELAKAFCSTLIITRPGIRKAV